MKTTRVTISPEWTYIGGGVSSIVVPGYQLRFPVEPLPPLPKPPKQAVNITREQFDAAVEAVWSEIEYQNTLSRRTDDSEAKNPDGFATLGRVYLRRLEDAWALTQGNEAALPELRKLAAIFLRGMIYCGVRRR